MIDVLTWKWGKKFGPEYVDRLRDGFARHLHVQHRFHLVTDDPSNVDPRVVTHPMFYGHADMMAAQRSCFRRIRMYHRDFAELVGPRILHVDLDVVLVADVTPLFDRSEPLVVYDQGGTRKQPAYNPSLVLMDAGVLHHMWEEFDAEPKNVHARARQEGWQVSDMAVLGYYASRMRPLPPTWGPDDGVYAYWRDVRGRSGALPPGARVVTFHGNDNPGDAKVRALCPWLDEHWGCV